MLEEFFAVTETSVYCVQAKGPVATKIALDGASDVAVGTTLKGGSRIAICNRLIVYEPIDDDTKIEDMNPLLWGGRSSTIVALFMTEEEALACFNGDDLESCDPRWADQTLRVVTEIGDAHPVFEVCRTPELALPLLTV